MMDVCAQIREFNEGLDLGCAQSVIERLGNMPAELGVIRNENLEEFFVLPKQAFFNGRGNLAYFSKGLKGTPSRLTFIAVADTDAAIAITRSSLYTVFPELELELSEDGGGCFRARDQANMIHFIADHADAEALAISGLFFIARDAGGKFARMT